MTSPSSVPPWSTSVPLRASGVWDEVVDVAARCPVLPVDVLGMGVCEGAWVFSRLRELVAAAAGCRLESVTVDCDRGLEELVRSQWLAAGVCSEYRGGQVLLSVPGADPLLVSWMGSSRSDLSGGGAAEGTFQLRGHVRSSVSFLGPFTSLPFVSGVAYPGLVPLAELELRWVFQFRDLMSPADAIAASRALAPSAS